MNSVFTIGSFVLLLSAPVLIAFGQSSRRVTHDAAAFEKEKAAILEVIERESAAFWAKDFQRWADTWVQAEYISRVGWWQGGGVSSSRGWKAIGGQMKKAMEDNPQPNPTPAKVVRDRLNFRIYGDVAWVTFEQRGLDTGEPRFDMPGLSYETRIFEKHNGKWKITYLGYLLEEKPQSRR